MSITIQDALKQSVQINELFQKLIKTENTARFAGDRIAAQIRANFIFRTGDSAPGQMTFNVPENWEFYGSRLYLFLEAKRLNLTNSTQSDVVYTPVPWVQTDPLFLQPQAEASCTFSISESELGDMQNAASSILFAFSSHLAYGFPGSLEFPTPVVLCAGSTLTVRITPTFSGEVSSTDKREFRIAGVLDGWKTVKS